MDKQTFSLDDIEKDIRKNKIIKYLRRKLESSEEGLSPEVADVLDKEQLSEDKLR